MSIRRKVLGVATTAAAAILALIVLPGQAGGVIYVVPTGTSMRPAISAGDLVLVRPAGDYQVGEIVAYRSATLGATVLHRIVAVSADGYATRGDNNGWLDPDHPDQQAVLGKVWLKVPRGGALLVRSAIPLGTGLAVGSFLLMLLGRGRRGRRSRPVPRRARYSSRRWSRAPSQPRSGETGELPDTPLNLFDPGATAARSPHLGGPLILPDTSASRRPTPEPDPAPAAPTPAPAAFPAPAAGSGWSSAFAPSSPHFASATAVVAVVAAGLAGIGFGLPADTRGTHPTAYDQHLTFSYQANGAVTAAYPDGTVSWGDPVYLRLVDRLEVQVTHRLASTTDVPVTGTLTLHTWLESTNGWRGRLVPDVTVALTGTTGSASTRLPLADITRLSSAVERATGAPLGTATVTVEAVADVTGIIAGQPVHAVLEHPLHFRVDGPQLVLAADKADVTSTGTVAAPFRRANRWSVLGVGVPVPLLRWASLACGALALFGAAAGLFARRRPHDVRREVAQRYPDGVVRVGAVDDDLPVIDVASAQDLFRLADRTGQLVLHYGAPGDDGYLLEYGATRYRFAPGAAPDGDLRCRA